MVRDWKKLKRSPETLEEKDWIRISIDAAGEGTYKDLHLPKQHVTLDWDIRKSKKGEKEESDRFAGIFVCDRLGRGGD